MKNNVGNLDEYVNQKSIKETKKRSTIPVLNKNAKKITKN